MSFLNCSIPCSLSDMVSSVGGMVSGRSFTCGESIANYIVNLKVGLQDFGSHDRSEERDVKLSTLEEVCPRMVTVRRRGESSTIPSGLDLESGQ